MNKVRAACTHAGLCTPQSLCWGRPGSSGSLQPTLTPPLLLKPQPAACAQLPHLTLCSATGVTRIFVAGACVYVRVTAACYKTGRPTCLARGIHHLTCPAATSAAACICALPQCLQHSSKDGPPIALAAGAARELPQPSAFSTRSPLQLQVPQLATCAQPQCLPQLQGWPTCRSCSPGVPLELPQPGVACTHQQTLKDSPPVSPAAAAAASARRLCTVTKPATSSTSSYESTSSMSASGASMEMMLFLTNRLACRKHSCAWPGNQAAVLLQPLFIGCLVCAMVRTQLHCTQQQGLSEEDLAVYLTATHLHSGHVGRQGLCWSIPLAPSITSTT